MKKLLLILLSALSLTALAQNRKTVAVLDPICRDNSVNAFFKLQVRGAMESAVTASTEYEAYDRSAFDQIQEEHTFQRTGAVNDSTIKKMGEMAGVDYVLVSEVSAYEGYLSVIVKILNVTTGRSNKSKKDLMKLNPENVNEKCDELALALLGEETSENATRMTTTTTNTTTSSPATNTNPRQSASTPPNQNSNKRVVIPEIVNRIGDISYMMKTLLRGMLKDGVTLAGYEVYTRSDIMAQVTGNNDFQQSGYISAEDIRKIGIMMSAAYVLVAEATTYDDTNIFISAKLIDVETSSIVTISGTKVLATNDLTKMKEACISIVTEMLEDL